MRVAFVLQDLQLSGGVGVVLAHVSRLRAAHGIDVQIVLAREPAHAPWPYPELDDLPVLSFAEAREQDWDLGVATWWLTTAVLFHLPCRRYAYFIQALEDSLYTPEEPERVAAAMTTALPVRFITEAHWIAEMLERLQPGNPAIVVRNGIDKGVFTLPPAPPVHDGPLRILLEGASGRPLKGVDQALDVIASLREPAHVTWVAPHGLEPGAERPHGVARVLERLSHGEMAEVYADSDVLLKLSRAEGMYGPPLEGFHRGCTVVTTAVTGHDEYVRHRENGLVCGWDDVPGTARMLDLLARDRELLARLRGGALATARAWPDWDACAAEMAAALRRVVAEPGPDGRGAALRLASELATVTAELQQRDRSAADAWAAERFLRQEKAYKLALALRRRVHRVRAVAGRVRRQRD